MDIVIVDDDALQVEVLKGYLEACGYGVTACTSAEEALARVMAGEGQVVISDWEMPGMDGPELCRRLRRAGLDRYVYIVLLTGREGRSSLVTGLSAGADDFLSKPFDPSELRVRLSVAERIVGLETRDLTIFAMARLAESRDPETGAHLERVRGYCRVLAEAAARRPEFAGQIDGAFVRMLYLTSPLHDIGKVGVPDCVLLKPARLNDEEFAVMKSHARIGGETLDAALRHAPRAKFLEMARDIAWTHHEQWNGSGYPHGLSGESIPLAGRIMALADVYDALRARRPYKQPFAHETARALVVEGAGKHFDPRLIEVFEQVQGQFDQIAKRYTDGEHGGMGEPAGKVVRAAA